MHTTCGQIASCHLTQSSWATIQNYKQMINRRKSNVVSVCIPCRTVTLHKNIKAWSVVWGSMMIPASNCTTPVPHQTALLKQTQSGSGSDLIIATSTVFIFFSIFIKLLKHCPDWRCVNFIQGLMVHTSEVSSNIFMEQQRKKGHLSWRIASKLDYFCSQPENRKFSLLGCYVMITGK
jgi:hypothetical protein